jgi:hypothetical protein
VGRGIEDHGRVLFPIARSLRVILPFGRAGAVWSRPVGVLVEEAGSYRHVRVRDRTREVRWGILGAGLVIALTMRVVGRRTARRELRWR